MHQKVKIQGIEFSTAIFGLCNRNTCHKIGREVRYASFGGFYQVWFTSFGRVFPSVGSAERTKEFKALIL
jgi:hypothetical protein